MKLVLNQQELTNIVAKFISKSEEKEVKEVTFIVNVKNTDEPLLRAEVAY